MNFNLNSGYGQALAHALNVSVPVSGKLFIVGDSGTANLDMIKEMFVPDPDGTIRFYSTVAAAIGACTANAGDAILVAPGHVETISSATSVVLDVAGVSIIGMGVGDNRPEFNFTATASSLELDAANCRLSNFILRADISAVVVGVNVDANGIQIDNCKWTFNATGDDFITMIDIDAVDDVKLINNEMFAEEGAAGCDEAIRLDTCDNVVIHGNHISGDFTDGAIIGEGAAGTNLRITENFIYNADTTAGFVVDLNVAFTGLLGHNTMGTLFAAAPETTVDPGSLLSVENYVCNAVNESGALVPVTVST